MAEDNNVVALPGAKAKAAPRLVVDLDTIKDDLGMPAGNENDAWLQRRIDEAWARFEKYTSRFLAVPPATFIDDWSLIASAMHIANQPPVLEPWPIGSPFLRCCPVVSIEAIRCNSQDLDPTKVRFEAATGKLFSLQENWRSGHDVSGELRLGDTAITYKAGWATVPPDLNAALLGVLAVQWGQRSGQAAGMPGGGAIHSINVVDVGTVDLSSTSAFVDSANKYRSPTGTDPLLGPWQGLLDPYMDYRVQIGSPLIPVTTMAPVPP